MSTLVEMIEALQKELNEPGRHQGRLPEGLAIELSVKLDPILAAAREQAQELAAMKEQFFPQGFPLSWLEAVRRMERQHDADLRKIAHICASMCVVEEDVEKATETIIRTFRKQKAEVKAQ